MKVEVPVVGKTYYAFGDGKISISRRMEVDVVAVYKFVDAPKKYLKKWRKVIADEKRWSYRIFAEKTDFIIVAEYCWDDEKYNLHRDTILFARKKTGGWYAFDGGNCILDVDNSLTVTMLNNTVDCLWEELNDLKNEVDTLKKSKAPKKKHK